MSAPTSRALFQSCMAFLQDGKSINVGSADAQGRPSLVRALGCKVGPEEGTLTLFLNATQAGALLADIAAHGRIAAVFSDPPTHSTLQLKGRDARVVPTQPQDVALALDYIESFARVLAPLGFRPDFIRTVQAFEPGDLASVVFTPEALFDQTPGPHAGSPMEGVRA